MTRAASILAASCLVASLAGCYTNRSALHADLDPLDFDDTVREHFPLGMMRDAVIAEAEAIGADIGAPTYEHPDDPSSPVCLYINPPGSHLAIAPQRMPYSFDQLVFCFDDEGGLVRATRGKPGHAREDAEASGAGDAHEIPLRTGEGTP